LKSCRAISALILIFAPCAPIPAAAGEQSTTWNPAMELVINVEVAQIDAPRVHRPYVAVWIEDQRNFPIRTVALWTQKPKYIPDLKAWYHDEGTRSSAEGGSELAPIIASATRSAGKYAVKWDGKDNKGQLVKAGKYTVCIEAAREHGTYQIIRQEMDFSGTPKQVNLPGNTELSSASLDYRKSSSH
jgi:thiamine biosynthesis lipoprotein